MHIALGTFGFAAVAIAAVWAWLGAEVAMPPAPVDTDIKISCISYAPFRGRQSPLDPGTVVPAAEIAEDLARLRTVTDCVRTYATDLGVEQVPEIARRLGMQVIQGIWVSRNAADKRRQIEAGIALATKYPDVVRAVIVGNEVLLRGEISPRDLAAAIIEVKAQVPVPVTYADVWEFWLRHRELAQAVDFVTVHILPYWEDFPIPAKQAAAHVDAIRQRVIAAFPGKDVFIGETGWPSQGRMREGALPSPANQALVLHEIVRRAGQGNYAVNVIEAFDQPWKRRLEGTVGGYWGLYDHATRRPKFAWGEAVSNHPFWRRQAVGGIGFAGLVFAAAIFASRSRGTKALPHRTWPGTAAIALVGGIFVAWAIETAVAASFDFGSWLRSLALVAVALGAPIAGAAALHAGATLPSFAAVLGHRAFRPGDPLSLASGILLVAVTVLAAQSALGLVFDPRYRDFPFAALTAAILPLLLVSLALPRPRGARGAAETTAAAVLALCAIYIVLNEGFANWQAVWFCGLLLTLAVILRRVRGAPD